MRKNCSTLSRSSIRHDAFDKVAYEEILYRSKELQSLSTQGMHILNTFTEMAEDVFFSLYKVKPELTLANELVTEYLLNHELMSKLMESQSYQELREYTQLDEFGAGLGSKALLENLLKQLEQDSDLKEVSNKINGAVEQQVGIADEVHQRVASLQSKIRRLVDLAADKAVGEVEEVEQIITSWGLNQGEFTRLPYEKKLELLNVLRNQQKFKDMTKQVGRMRRLANASRKAKLEHRVELHSITQGADINHVLPQELLALRRPALKLDFYRRMMEKQLFQYDLNQREPVGQGPIIALIDMSSSMVGDREHWSKAVALGLAEIAEKERRGFSYALFASSRADLVTDDFQIGQRSPDKLMKLATEFIGGGTNFEQPLNWAMDKLQEGTFNKADIVMITDGECAISDEFLKALQKVKEQKECRIYSILIGNSLREVKRWSDAVWSITDLIDETTVQELFQKI